MQAARKAFHQRKANETPEETQKRRAQLRLWHRKREY